MPFYDRGDVRIHYEEAGSGFPGREADDAPGACCTALRLR